MNISKFAGVCVIKDGLILLVQESHKEAYGLWSLPLGHIEEGENEEFAAIRESKEETGLDLFLKEKFEMEINGLDFKSINKYNNNIIKLTIFSGDVIGGNLIAGDGILNAKWFDINKINDLSLRGDWVKSFIYYFR